VRRSSSAFLAPSMERSRSRSPSPDLLNESRIEERDAGGAGSSSSHHLPPIEPPKATPSPIEGASLCSLFERGEGGTGFEFGLTMGAGTGAGLTLG